jgi:two-component system, chemotaxis family, chemotaxis protein CheY
MAPSSAPPTTDALSDPGDRYSRCILGERRNIRYLRKHTDVSEPGPVLVVDDDTSIRDLIEMALADSGYAVETAADGAAALEVIGHTRPSMILLDMRMPGMNGWEFARAYRRLPGPHVPIVVLTAARDAGRRAAEISAEAFLGKPFDLNDLLAIVAEYAASER